MCHRCSAYAFISIYLYQRPVGMTDDKLLVILLLKLIGGCLLDIVRGNTGIHRYSLRNIIVVVVNLLFCGDAFIISGINRRINPSMNLLLFFNHRLLSLGKIIHGAYPLHRDHHREAVASLERGRKMGLLDPPDSMWQV